MALDRDPLFVRAALALECGRVRCAETQRVIDTVRLLRLEREFASKLFQLEQLVSRRPR